MTTPEQTPEFKVKYLKAARYSGVTLPSREKLPTFEEQAKAILDHYTAHLKRDGKNEDISTKDFRQLLSEIESLGETKLSIDMAVQILKILNAPRSAIHCIASERNKEHLITTSDERLKKSIAKFFGSWDARVERAIEDPSYSCLDRDMLVIRRLPGMPSSWPVTTQTYLDLYDGILERGCRPVVVERDGLIKVGFKLPLQDLPKHSTPDYP